LSQNSFILFPIFAFELLINGFESTKTKIKSSIQDQIINFNRFKPKNDG